MFPPTISIPGAMEKKTLSYKDIGLIREKYLPDMKQAGIPVLWLLNNDEVEPPWGKVARIKV